MSSDLAALTLTAVGEYPVPVERLFAAWTNPRQVERFWGPPQWPATFTRLEPHAGGRADYHMTGPEGQVSRGYWSFVRVDPPRGFVVRDGFAQADGSPDPSHPETEMELAFEATPGGSRFVATSRFASVEAMEALLAMGMAEGFTAALGQLDAVLADLRELSAGFTTALTRVGDKQAVVTREVRGTIHQVWRCHHEPALMRRWMLGPPGWTMPVCETATEVGGAYRYEWEQEGSEGRFGFVGEVLEIEPPRRSVTTERMLGTDGPSTRNELVLTPRPGGRTLIEVRITYPSAEVREMILATGMAEGMEASYARMEAEVVDDA